MTSGVAAIMTVLHEAPERLARRFADLARQDHSIDEVVVAAPAEDHQALAAAVPPTAPFALRLVDNPGGQRSAGLNLAARAAAPELLVRVDARSAISPTHISVCATILRERPEVGVVGGPQRPVAGGADEMARGIARALANPWALGGAAYRRVGRAGPVDTVYLGAFRKQDLIDVGGYDERLDANEDFDLCQRFRRSGAVVWLDPTAGVAYECRTSLRSVALQYFAFGRSKATYWRLTGTRAQARQRIPLVGLAAAAALLGWVVRRPRRALPMGLAAVVGVALVDEFGSRQPVSATVRASALLTYPVVWVAWTVGVVEGRMRGAR